MSAGAKKVTPPAAAARTSGWASSSLSTHCLLLLSPKLIMPRQIRETPRPVEPRLTYSMNTPCHRFRRQMRFTRTDAMALRGQRHLGVDVIGLYQFHRPDPKVPYAESIGAIKELLDAGKIRLAGISNA